MATYFSSCGDNTENFNLCIQNKVAGFISKGYNTGDLVFLIVKERKSWMLGAKGFLKEPTEEKPWNDAEKYKSAFKIKWITIIPVDITAGLQKIYSNYGLAIQG